MKRLATLLLTFSACTFFYHQSFAQVGFGVKAGANYLAGSQKIQPDPKDPPTNPKGLGMQFGGYVEIPFSDLVGLRPELVFSFRRMKTDNTNTTTYTQADNVTLNGMPFTGTQTILTETDQRLTYFQINAPLMLKPTEGLRVMFGPAFNFLMGGKQNTDVTTTVKGTVTNQGQQQSVESESFEATKKKGSTATRNFKKTDVAAFAGIGYTLEVGLDLDLRYYRGLSTTYDESAGSSRYRIWSNLVEFSVGWTFGG
ncbi:MAG: PorT family protein [Flavobacteriales bacterium]|jgi:hypothetical protein|nr:PorT family protein [Flavobacteriales bacterium]